jgi:hypothetical protein
MIEMTVNIKADTLADAIAQLTGAQPSAAPVVQTTVAAAKAKTATLPIVQPENNSDSADKTATEVLSETGTESDAPVAKGEIRKPKNTPKAVKDAKEVAQPIDSDTHDRKIAKCRAILMRVANKHAEGGDTEGGLQLVDTVLAKFNVAKVSALQDDQCAAFYEACETALTIPVAGGATAA